MELIQRRWAYISSPEKKQEQMANQDHFECDEKQINGCLMLVSVNWMDIKIVMMGTG